MAEVSIPRQLPIYEDQTPADPLGSGHLSTNPIILSGPEPNPPFVFPVQAETNNTEDPGNSNASEAHVSTRRSINRSRPQRLSMNALPAFDFHPSTSDNSTTNAAASSRSPARSIPTGPHTSGHRRNGSEFIGGDGQAGGPGLMSTSPTKNEGALPAPPNARLGPPGGRRGHAHRRSGAVSSHDLSMIMKPSSENHSEARGSSAPTTPLDTQNQRSFLPEDDMSSPRSATAPSSQASSPVARRRENVSTSGLPRARVGFSDTVEFIPRPLSTISSETSSSMSTIRPNHSVTDSITSTISTGPSSPPSAKASRSLLDVTYEQEAAEPRPRTAGAVLHGSSQDFGLEQSTKAHKRPSSASASRSVPMGADLDISPARRRIFGDGRGSGISPKNSASGKLGEPTNITQSNLFAPPKERPKSHRTSQRPISQSSSPLSRPRSSPEPKISKKQRKVPSWAGSMLTRKARPRTPKEKIVARRSPTPPLRNFAPPDDFPLEEVNFDEDTSCVIHTPFNDTPRTTRAQTDFSNWRPRQSSPTLEYDSLSPMLDLDAALGPFNTPSLGPESGDTSTGGFSLARRRMHSSGATGGFTGPGMHYHRRAESAPEMVAINRQIFGLHRLGSDSNMADVFEEEEEDEGLAKGSAEGLLGLGVEIVDINSTEDGSLQPSTETEQDESYNSLGAGIDSEGANLIEIVHAEEEPRASMVTKSSDESTVTPRLSHDPLINRPASAPIDFALPRSGFLSRTPETPSSAVSSPDFDTTSFDIPRINTATSSITDRVTWSSSRTGDQSLDRGSVDDVPSLTSSASTMMSAHPPRFSSSAGTRSSAERSSSFSAVVPPRTRSNDTGKRSSLASLSRLVGSSYGEKSKLSQEERAQPDNAERSEKKKGNRISRLMQFWKSKEKSASS
ncbi:hypothetical protein MMC12_006117 [Toensbergia leucococca]|nr:hypothetical protein [Toensbergia leucococca]